MFLPSLSMYLDVNGRIVFAAHYTKAGVHVLGYDEWHSRTALRRANLP